MLKTRDLSRTATYPYQLGFSKGGGLGPDCPRVAAPMSVMTFHHFQYFPCFVHKLVYTLMKLEATSHCVVSGQCTCRVVAC